MSDPSTSSNPGQLRPGQLREDSAPSLRQATLAWMRVALLSVGGPAAQIAVMHRIIVEEKRWISEQRFVHALNFCMLLPGPEAQQLATYLGLLLNGRLGGFVAGVLFILPGFLTILALSLLYAPWHQTVTLAGILFGMKCAVVAIVAEAMFRIGRKVLKTHFHIVIAAAAFVAIYFLHLPFPGIIGGAALIGLLFGRQFEATSTRNQSDSEEAIAQALPKGRFWLTLPLFLALWWLPILGLGMGLGWDHLFVQEGWFFSKTAVVTFGGAYAVLPYVAQQAVERFGWLTNGQMQDGLGLAETTPGPLIMVVQFVGFMAAYQNPGSLPPWLAGVLGSIVTVWVTFVPCFLWVFLGAPYVERLRNVSQLKMALESITAAVVGVILNLAVWFAFNTLFLGKVEQASTPLFSLGDNSLSVAVHWPRMSLADLSPAALLLTLASLVMLLYLRWNLFAVLGLSMGVGWLLRTWGLA